MTGAVIIGGGIAGVVTAVALHEAGIGSAVYEAYPTLTDDVGAFLPLAVNGMDALAAVGLDGAVAAAGEPARRIEVYDADGAKVGDGPLADADTHDLVPRTFLRSALYRVLLDEAERPGVRVERGRRLVDATTSAGQGRAVFADSSRTDGDLLVGADGLPDVPRAFATYEAAPSPRGTAGRSRGRTEQPPAPAAQPQSGRPRLDSWPPHRPGLSGRTGPIDAAGHRSLTGSDRSGPRAGRCRTKGPHGLADRRRYRSGPLDHVQPARGRQRPTRRGPRSRRRRRA